MKRPRKSRCKPPCTPERRAVLTALLGEPVSVDEKGILHWDMIYEPPPPTFEQIIASMHRVSETITSPARAGPSAPSNALEGLTEGPPAWVLALVTLAAFVLTALLLSAFASP